MTATKFTIELDIGPPSLTNLLLPQLMTNRQTKLIVVGGPRDHTAIADAALKNPEAERPTAPSYR